MNVIRQKPIKDRLTQAQMQLADCAKAKTNEVDAWIKKEGLDVQSFAQTHVQLLQAQRQAHALLSHHSHLLSCDQVHVLEKFQQQMAKMRTRRKLKPSAAIPVLNISTKINRQLFKQYKYLKQA
jgi:hypothetical protein